MRARRRSICRRASERSRDAWRTGSRGAGRIATVVGDSSYEPVGMYRTTGAGEEPVPPALLCMASLVQGYLGVSDAEMVELTVVDLRAQLALGCLGAEKPVFGQGTLQQHRERLIRNNMDRRLLERTREVAKRTKAFDWKKLPKDLRVGIDSRPFLGAGRVEDTFNLLGHAARKVVECMAGSAGMEYEEACRTAGIPLLLSPSIKAGLDINWNDPEQRDVALNVLLGQVVSLHAWIMQEGILLDDILQGYIEAVAQVHAQDIEEVRDGRAHPRQGAALAAAGPARPAASASAVTGGYRRSPTRAHSDPAGATPASLDHS